MEDFNQNDDRPLLGRRTLLEGGEMDNKMMDPKEGEEEEEFNHWIAYPLAILSAVFFGVGNFILILIGYEEGMKTFYPQCIAAIALFLLYHSIAWLVSFCKEGSFAAYFSASNSGYRDEAGDFSFGAFLQPIIKAGLVFPNGVSLLFAALYGWAAGLNIGLVFSEYNASSIIFVILLFALTYDQRITILDWIAMALIVIAVFDISYLGNWERDKEQDDTLDPTDPPIDRTEEHKDLAISVLLAVLAGLIQAFIGLQVYFVEKDFKRLSQLQLTFDALLPFALAMAPFFIWIMIYQD